MGADVYSTEVYMCFDAASGITERSALMQAEWSGRAPKMISRFTLIEPRHSCPDVQSAALWRQRWNGVPTQRTTGVDGDADVYSTVVNMCCDAACGTSERSALMQTGCPRQAPRMISCILIES